MVISREQVGSISHEDLGMWKLSAKWVPKCLNVDQKRQRCQSSEQLLEFFQCDPNDFLSRLVTMDKTWSYHYGLETRQQSMDWGHCSSHHQQKFRVQKSTGKFSPQFFGIKTASSSLIIFQRPNYQCGVLLTFAGANEGHFEGKTLCEDHQGRLVLA